MGGRPARIFRIDGIAGDTGGTLTITGFSRLAYANAIAYTAAAGLSDVGTRIDGNTVVITYANPAAGHTVDILVVQG